MKKATLVFLISLFVLSLCVVYYQPAGAQNKSSSETSAQALPAFSQKDDKVRNVAQTVEASKAGGANFERRTLFQPLTKGLESQAQSSDVLSTGVVLNLDGPAVADTLQQKPETLTLPLPDGQGGTVELELTKSNIFAAGFSVKTSIPTTEDLDEGLGLHYRGIVKGDAGSVAAISVFKDEVMGFYSTEAEGNSVVGRLAGNNPANEHIVYDVKDLKVTQEFACATKDPDVSLPALALQEPAQASTACVRMYLEGNYDLFQNKGSVANATSHLTGLFNQSATLFSNDGIPVTISEIFIWNSPSPYNGSDSFAVLTQFQSNRSSFNGDLAHLITLNRNFGGIAYVNILCNQSYAYAVSDIDSTYNNVPTYSWSVNVFMHETGHNLASPHTHACAWNGNGTAIDSCGPSVGYGYEGSCSNAPLPPSNGGTIMSYCHLNVGVNFSLGFGTQPRNLIRNRINDSSCLSCDGDSCTPTTITVGQPLNGWLLSNDCRYPAGSSKYSDAYTFNGTAGQQVFITMSLSDFDTWVALRDPSGTELTSDNDGGGGTDSRIPAGSGFYTLPSTGTYTIQASSNLDNATGFYVIGVMPPAPANDNFLNAQAVTGTSGNVPGTNVGATDESGEPIHGGNGAGSKSVWYSWQAPGSGSTTITTLGSNFDTLLGVYTGSSVSSLTLIGSNNQHPSGGNHSGVTFNATAGTIYRIAVGGFAAASGNLILNWSLNTSTNFALTTNGGVASASSTLDAGRAPGAANNGDRRGIHWGWDPSTGSGWHDATAMSYSDWLQIDFAESKTINEIDVFSVQDNHSNPSEPTDTMTFESYGIMAFEVQYWTGSAWLTVPGGSVTGNNKVKRTVTFSPIATSRIRVLVHSAQAGYSRITEVEAWGPTAVPPLVNMALASNGGVAVAFSTLDSGRLPSAVNNGDRRGLHWGSDPSTGSGWHDGSFNNFPDWIRIDFAGSKSISEIDVYTVQDNYSSPLEPTDAMTFGLYGITAFEVQYFSGSTWITVPGGSVTGNNKVKRTFTFSPVAATQVRVLVHNGLASHSRITEIEAWGPVGSPGVNVALASNGGLITASSVLDAGRAATAAINGDRRGAHWGTDPSTGSGWHDATLNTHPDSLQISFAGTKSINEITVFTIQDDYSNPSEPTDALTFGLYGITQFEVQFWTGASWLTLPTGNVSGNNKVRRTFTFAPVSTSQIRVLVHSALGGYTRIVEVEAYQVL